MAEVSVDDRVRAVMQQVVQSPAEVGIAPLHGHQSLTNSLRAVRDPGTGTRYAVRVPDPRAEHVLGIDRREELRLLKAAARAGLGPPVLAASDDGTLVMPLLPEVRHWRTGDLPAEVAGERLPTTVRALLATPPAHPQDPTIFDRIRRIIRGAHTLGSPAPSEQRLLADLAALETVREEDQRWPDTLAHHDLWPNNLLDTGEELLIIDLEFGGRGDGFFDLATLAHAGNLDDDARRALLGAVGRGAREADLAILRDLTFAVRLFDATWAWAMAHVGHRRGSFDYLSHAERSFAALGV